MKKIKCSILFSCYNRLDSTLIFLESLQKAISELENFNFKLLVFDDGDDKTGQYIKLKFPNIKIDVYNGDGSYYWNGGMRHLMENLKPNKIDFFIFLNDDIVLKKDSIKTLFSKYFISSQTKKIVSGKFISKFSNEYTYGVRNLNYQIINKSEEGFFLNGNLVLFPISVLKDVGLLSDRFCHSLGDWDYGLRLKDKGYKLIMTENTSGFCETNPIPSWFDPSINILERVNSFRKTKKMNLKEHYYFNKTHFGLFQAIKSIIAISLNILSPNIYQLIKKHESSYLSRWTWNKDKRRV